MVKSIVRDTPSQEGQNADPNEWLRRGISAGQFQLKDWQDRDIIEHPVKTTDKPPSWQFWKKSPDPSPLGGSMEINFNHEPYSFIPSAEGQQIVDDFRNRHGIDINVQPMQYGEGGVDVGLGASGYYMQQGDPRYGRGGHSDPDKRTVYLDKNYPTSFVLAHELGHAFDPELVSRQEKGWKQTENTINKLHTPPGISASDFLTGYAGKGSLGDSKFVSELEAQKQGIDTFNKFDMSSPLSKEDLGAYPYSYISQGIDQAENYLTFPNVPNALINRVAEERFGGYSKNFGPRQTPYKTNFDLGGVTIGGVHYPSANFDYSDQALQNQMRFDLNQDYQNTKTNIKNERKDFAKEYLGEYTNPIYRTPSDELNLAVQNLSLFQ